MWSLRTALDKSLLHRWSKSLELQLPQSPYPQQESPIDLPSMESDQQMATLSQSCRPPLLKCYIYQSTMGGIPCYTEVCCNVTNIVPDLSQNQMVHSEGLQLRFHRAESYTARCTARCMIWQKNNLIDTILIFRSALARSGKLVRRLLMLVFASRQNHVPSWAIPW